MGYWYLWALAAAVVIYLALQHVDDERNRKQGKPVAGMGQRVMLGFLILVVCLVMFYMLFGIASGSGGVAIGGGTEAGGGGGDGREAWYNNIHEDIRVGLPTF